MNTPNPESTKKRANIGLDLIGIALAIAFVVGGWVWIGYVSAVLWAWFAVPILGLPVITVAQAMGLRMVIGIFFITFARKMDIAEVLKKTANERWARLSELFGLYVGAGLVLLVGWAVKQFI